MSLSETQEMCVYANRLARMIGRILSIEIGVDESGNRLIFVDSDGEPIHNDGEEIIAVTPEEIEKKDIGDFLVRALRAAGIAKFQEIERSRT